MNLTLQPQASFTIVRQIENHLDTDTNYVQAVIRNAYTDAIIATVQLTSRGGQRFSINWQVPADPSGQGFYVSIVTSVYTDAGYTTKNPNYGDEENTYLVQERVLTPGGHGGIDAYTVRQILIQELDKREPSLSGITGAIGALQREVNRIPKDGAQDRSDELLAAIRANAPKEAEPIDLGPILSAVGDLKAAIDAKEVTPATDLTPVLDAMRGDAEVDDQDFSELKGLLAALETSIIDTVQGTIGKALGETKFVSSFTTEAQPKPAAAPAKAPAIDISKLAS